MLEMFLYFFDIQWYCSESETHKCRQEKHCNSTCGRNIDKEVLGIKEDSNSSVKMLQ